jgi:hypothetical protein
MANMHIKTINGKRYYYQSIRKGKKVTSKYIGPVEEHLRIRKREVREEDLILPEDSYIG